MTDTQQINASVLADWLECVKQMRNSFKAYKATLAADDTKKGFVSMLEIRMESATPDLDALRALVAEQEQASEMPVYTAEEIKSATGFIIAKAVKA